MKSPAGPLWYEFYSSSCPKAEKEVTSVVREIISKDHTMGAAFLNLFFHDCFVRGCDASILLGPTKSNEYVEKRTILLRGFDAVDKVKAAVEAIFPGVVSCADILAFAARDSVLISGRFGFVMPSGRRDGLVSQEGDAFRDLPTHSDKIEDHIRSFASKGLGADDLVALSGAHSFGVAHCGDVVGRLDKDPTMNATLNAALKEECSSDNPRQEVYMNQVTDTNKLSNQYYRDVASGEVLFASDQHLMDLNSTAAKVAYYADNPMVWMAQFAVSMVKMGSIRILTGSAGEVRRFCNVTNNGA
ncbi:Peroxidase 2 [Dichanthelium oligosanthes]|uniref:Peroxidase n=1 Tax=Dichanthelium oligosanthes TaxID=888268 RepID=A0A1E5UPC6_9POAL|nr:Peroxidase 2 [Dichanthelium oligosanthes]